MHDHKRVLDCLKQSASVDIAAATILEARLYLSILFRLSDCLDFSQILAAREFFYVKIIFILIKYFYFFFHENRKCRDHTHLCAR